MWLCLVWNEKLHPFQPLWIKSKNRTLLAWPVTVDIGLKTTQGSNITRCSDFMHTFMYINNAYPKKDSYEAYRIPLIIEYSIVLATITYATCISTLAKKFRKPYEAFSLCIEKIVHRESKLLTRLQLALHGTEIMEWRTAFLRITLTIFMMVCYLACPLSQLPWCCRIAPISSW